jgi:hypothetical protein
MSIEERLQAPFKPCEIEWRVGSTNKDKTKGLALAYVTNRAIQNRLDDLFGVFGWRNEYVPWKNDSQLCGISIWSDERQDWITKWDGASDSNMEATKGGLSDAMKRAAYQWGIGRYLYNLPSVWVPIKPQGKSYVLSEMPKLPAWALPEGTKNEDAGKPFNADITPEDEEYINNQQPPEDTGGKTDEVRIECEICKTQMTQGQQDVSKNKCDGRTLCPKHQKEVA